MLDPRASCTFPPRTNTITKYLSGDCVFYYNAGDDVALADTLRLMWDNPAEVSRHMAAARELVPRLSWEAEKEKFVSSTPGCWAMAPQIRPFRHCRPRAAGHKDGSRGHS